MNLAKNIKDDREELIKKQYMFKGKPAKERRYQLSEQRRLHHDYRHPLNKDLWILMKGGEIKDENLLKNQKRI